MSVIGERVIWPVDRRVAYELQIEAVTARRMSGTSRGVRFQGLRDTMLATRMRVRRHR